MQRLGFVRRRDGYGPLIHGRGEGRATHCRGVTPDRRGDGLGAGCWGDTPEALAVHLHDLARMSCPPKPSNEDWACRAAAVRDGPRQNGASDPGSGGFDSLAPRLPAERRHSPAAIGDPDYPGPLSSGLPDAYQPTLWACIASLGTCNSLTINRKIDGFIQAWDAIFDG